MTYISVYIKLTIAGMNVGPFDLYSDVDGFTNPFEENITREVLVAGYTSIFVPEGTTQIKLVSVGVCTNYVIIDIAVPTTSTTSTSTSTSSTSTTTSTTTAAPSLTYTINETDCEEDCPRTYGEILVDGVAVCVWNSYTPLPLSGVSYPSIGDTVTINAYCWAGGSCSIGRQATISILIDGTECDSAVDGEATCTFTFTEDSVIEVSTGCQFNP